MSAALAGCGAEGFDDDVGFFDYAVKKVCGKSGKTVEGIDVSKWQSKVDWKQVAGDGIVFGIARASHGLNYDDAFFTANWKGMKANGLIRGVYQYFAPKQDPIKQADFMLQKIKAAGGLEPGDLPPVLDLEELDGVPASTLRTKALAWLKHVEAATKKKPIIYTAAYFAQSNLGAALQGYPLWIANYTTPPSQGGCPLLPSGSWTRWHMWQYTSSGKVAGVGGRVDRNVFDGDKQALRAFIAKHTQGGVAGDGGAPKPDSSGGGGADAGTAGGDAGSAGNDALPAGGDGGVGGADASGAGPDSVAGGGDGGDGANRGNDNRPGGAAEGGCSVGHAGSSTASPATLWALWLLGLMLVRCRRRRAGHR